MFLEKINKRVYATVNIDAIKHNIKIISEKKNYAFGIIDKLIVSSPYRIKSDCPISYKCGGCDYRYIDYHYQLKLKKDVLINTFKGYKVHDIEIVIGRLLVGEDKREGEPSFFRCRHTCPEPRCRPDGPTGDAPDLRACPGRVRCQVGHLRKSPHRKDPQLAEDSSPGP